MVRLKLLSLGLLLSFNSTNISAQGTLEDYKSARRFLPENINKLVFNMFVSPNWQSNSNNFFYKKDFRTGKEFILVDPELKVKKHAFDHKKLAVSLSKILNDSTCTEFNLPFNDFKYLDGKKAIEFTIKDSLWECDLNSYQCTNKGVQEKKDQNISPDKKWTVINKENNLILKSLETNEEFLLTNDGEDKYSYGTYISWYKINNESNPTDEQPSEVYVSWSPDSKKFVTHRSDRRSAKKLYMWQAVPDSGLRAQVWSYERALTGDTTLTTVEYYVFDIDSKKHVKLDMARIPNFLDESYPEWYTESDKLYYNAVERGYQKNNFLVFDSNTGIADTLFSESSNTNVDGYTINVLKKSDEIIVTSQRDGWNHLYLINGTTGKVNNQITSGEFVVFSIKYIDEENRTIYFIGGGKQAGVDPYFQHLYKVNFDGSDFRLLTPEKADHDVTISDNHKYFVDNFSRIDLPTKSIVRDLENGKFVMDLEEADIDLLLETGWKFPEPFKVKARDGITDIYGAIFRPSNFDTTKKYPVIDGVYSGPHYVRTPKSFNKLFRAYSNGDIPLAELGFIVVNVDGLGTAKRSKKFHDFSYRNLGDAGLPDHIKAIKEMSKKYPYMNIEKVGIYGHSAGGFDAAHAVMIHPEFYKVAVSAAGNHDSRIVKAWWDEYWMGYPVEQHYIDQSNLTAAKKLNGKLLLIHGDMDNNVNPVATMRLVDELVKANKDFDLLILPNVDHYLLGNKYYIRKKWDYFVNNLLDIVPPKEFDLGE